MPSPKHAHAPRVESRGLMVAAFALLVAFFVITHILTMRHQRTARAQTDAVVHNMLSSIELVARMGRDLARERLLTDAHIFEKEAQSMDRIEADIRAVREDYAAAALAYQSMATLPGEASIWQKVQADVASLEMPLDHAVALSRMNEDLEARHALLMLDPHFAEIDLDLTELQKINRKGADEAVARVDALERSTAFVTALRTAVGILLTLAVGLFITRRVIQREEEAVRYGQVLETSNQELEAFAGRVAHDLREPLTTVAMVASRLTQLAPEQAEISDILERGVTRMQMIIEDLLALSRLTTSVQRGVSDPAVTVAEVREGLERAHANEDVSFNFDVEPAKVRCAEGLLRQVLTNLTSNAMKYRRAGIPAEIDVQGRTVGGLYVLLVRDNGEGMAPEDARQAFEPFYRAPRTRSQPGTGLGLAIVKRVVEASGGSVSIDSQLGHGTTFFVELPLASVELEPAIDPTHRSRAPA